MDGLHRVLLIEDDIQIGRLLSAEIGDLQASLDWVKDGSVGLACFRERDYDLLILDLMLPSMDGLDVCREIRVQDQFIPIIMLTARAEKREVVRGLELGADDYITKPFDTAELIARIQAIFRRISADRDRDSHEDGSICRGDLVIYPDKRKVLSSGEPVHLTAKEFDLLLLFAENPGYAFSRSELLNNVWGSEFEGFDHTVNTHINRLRSKIRPSDGEADYIETVWGIGYRFAERHEAL